MSGIYLDQALHSVLRIHMHVVFINPGCVIWLEKHIREKCIYIRIDTRKRCNIITAD